MSNEESNQSVEKDDLIDYEVWRSGPSLKARDVRLYFGLDQERARATLDLCNKDMAEGYPNAPIEFYVMRVSRERVVLPPGKES
jgi:hypothetical protein